MEVIDVKAEFKEYLVKYRKFQNQAKDYFNAIDFEPLLSEVRKFAGCEGIQFEDPEYRGDTNDMAAYITLESNDLAKHCGILSGACKKAVISAFGTVTEENGEFCCGMSFTVDLYQSDSSIPRSIAYLEARHEAGKWDVWKRGYAK